MNLDALLSTGDALDLRSTLRSLAADHGLGKAIVWYPMAVRQADLAAGTVAYGGVTSTFTAVVGPAKVDAAKGIKAGDQAMLVALSEVTPKVGDRCTVDGGPYLTVISIEPDPIGTGLALVIVSRVP